jgi:hypothetical protein
MSALVLVNRVHQGRQAARAGSKDRETLGGISSQPTTSDRTWKL